MGVRCPRRCVDPKAAAVVCLLLGLTLSSEASAATPASQPSRFTNSIGMRLIFVPAGEFMAGSPPEEKAPPAFKAIEKQERVQVKEPFYMGATEVTNRQFLRFVKETGYDGGKEGSEDFLRHTRDPDFAELSGPDQPVVFVSWNDCHAFCDWLTKKESRPYRLPSEWQWEYACRCGTRLTYGCADNPNDLLKYAWLRPNADGVTHKVGSKLPNAWGFYDMQGNVWEWTATLMDLRNFDDPEWARQGVFNMRGGAYDSRQSCARCAARWAGYPADRRFPTIGFRVVCTGGPSDQRPKPQ